jgi:catechol 2,3-dioxygenase-like lactoylglutathione lyase family enzyme
MRVRAVTPILNVSDVAASVDWFGKLGWAPGFSWCPPGETAPTFGAVVTGDFEIFLCLDGQGGRVRDRGVGGDEGVWISIWVDHAKAVDTVHATCVGDGLEVLRGPQDEPWGVREMQIRHPDGHVFRISAPVHTEHD